MISEHSNNIKNIISQFNNGKKDHLSANETGKQIEEILKKIKYECVKNDVIDFINKLPKTKKNKQTY
jgi:hypothetical protein